MARQPHRLERISLKDAALEILRAMILDGELAPGSQVDLDALGAELQVSERPLREALLVLESQGFVSVAPRRGTFVAALTRRDICDRLETLAIVSGLAAERAAATPSNGELRLRSVSAAAAALRRDPSAAGVWTELFEGLGAASRSRRIAEELDSAITGLGNRVVPASRIGRLSSHGMAARVVEAIERSDGAGARQLTETLVTAGQEPLLAAVARALVPEARPGDQQPSVLMPKQPAKVSVIAHMRAEIFSGSLKAGERLDVESLAAALGMSRSPVREALIVLEHEGLIRAASNRRTFINEFTPADITDHFEIFARLLDAGASQSIAALDGDGVVLLRGLREELRDPKSERLADAVFLFHRAVQRSGTSNWRRRDLRRLARTIPNWLIAPSLDDETWTWFQSFLDDVMAAVDGNDAAALGSTMAEGARQIAAITVDGLRDNGFWDLRSDHPQEAR